MAEFSLNIDEIEETVEKSLEEEKKNLPTEKIDEQANQNAIAIFNMDMNNIAERESIIKPLDDFGLAEMNRSAQRNNLLTGRLKDLNESGDEAGSIGSQLAELDKQVKDLNPSKVNFNRHGLFGKFMDPVRKYFEKYEKAEVVINNIVQSLDENSKVLQNDNVTLNMEEANLRELTKKLMTDIELAKQMDASIEAQIQEAQIQGIEEEKIQFVQEEILYPLRQRIMDMGTMITVNQQGIISLNIIRRNNKELIRGITRARTVTVTALRTGIMMAKALYDQKRAIELVNDVNKTTEEVITATSKMISQQTNEIKEISTKSMISPEVLQNSFNEALTAIEEISTFKREALSQMQDTINTFGEMAAEGQRVVDKIETVEK
ncbi:MAG: toxic anion resistance protein [Methanobrevibacter sp.]|uniref:toxic anion resistance protein n=1 Tax=Methanobrevibacter sp. TaxID=66852 RepID=UPI0026DFBF5F|nr:toxic anion resistance protein [Methanobrevibacter sp.]MDO5848126.1 toxic anion resistance protein [Methanobrevibacter sp.]